MDERYDLVRSVRDDRYVYVRNYMPHRASGQYVAYMFETPTTVVWKRLFEAGELPPEQTAYWGPRPAEELYDLEADPDEVVNLAPAPSHQRTLQRMREVQRRHALEIRDLGFLPEPEIYQRSGASETGEAPDSSRETRSGAGIPGETRSGVTGGSTTPFDLARDGVRYNLVEILRVAEQATDQDFYSAGQLLPALSSSDSAVRYWGAVGLLIRREPAVRLAHDQLRVLLGDQAPAVRIAAAEALGRYGSESDLDAVLATLLASAALGSRPLYEVVMALNAIDYLDGRAAGVRDRIEALPRQRGGIPRALEIFVPQLLDKILADLETAGG
jgi:uncharacterized sulfatase